MAVAALVTAVLSALIGVIAAPIELLLQLHGGAPFWVTVFGISAVIGVVAVVALVLAAVAARRSRSRAIPGAAIGVAGYVLVGPLAGAIAVVAVSLG
jgi:hypothetical protein